MASKIKVELRNEDKALVDSMLAAVAQEAGVRTKAEQDLLTASVTAWAKCRDTLKLVMERKPSKAELKAAKEAGEAITPAHVIAGAVLDALRTASEEAAKTDQKMSRGKQYASDLRRAVKLAAKGKAVPDKLWTATRTQWNEHEVWKDEGILAASGKKKGSKAAEADGASEEGDVAAAALKADPELSELMTVVATLHGPFRAEFMEQAKELALRIAKKQGQATGTGEGRQAVG